MKHSIDRLLMEQLIGITRNFRHQMTGGEGHAPCRGRAGHRDERGGRFCSPHGRGAFEAEINHGDERESAPFFRHGRMHGHRSPMARERLLHIIGKEEGVSQRKLAGYFSIRPQSLSELLVKLESDGYISRGQNENDKRETLVYLTEQGKTRAKEVEESRKKLASELFTALTDEEKETLSNILAKLLKSQE